MNASRSLAFGLIVIASIVVTVGADSPKVETEVILKSVKWPDLDRSITARKGKVVVIDVWADYCIPCKREFHNLVELHGKYAKDGLDCISLTVDDKDDAEKALTFLKKQKATFGNYLIDEMAEVWSRKLDVGGPPAVMVFDRSGKKVKTFTSEDPFTYADVEKFIQPLLKDKK